MKKLSLCLFIYCFWPVFHLAQNLPPAVTNLTVNHTSATQSATFNFDLSDPENDPVEIHLQVSADSGRTWLVVLDSIVGDTGFPVLPGSGKSITWVYDLGSLSSQLGGGTRDFQARIVADDRVNIDIQDIVNQVDSSRLVGRLEFVEGVRHRSAAPTHLNEVRDSLRNLISEMGLQAWHHTWNYGGGFMGENYVGRLSGTADEAKTWLVSGHYDSVTNSPAADDNGTATAAVMEAMQVLAPYHFKHSLRFVAFDLEEAGLRGSIEYVTRHVPDWEQIGGLVNLEMIGYKDDTPNSQSLPTGFNLLFPNAYQSIAADSFRGNFLTNVANTASSMLKAAFDSCAAQYVPDLKVISIEAPGNANSAPDLRRSDHAPFWDAGYQALMLTDAADLRNPNYHQASDSIGTLDLAFYFQNVKAVIATLAKLAVPHHIGTAQSTPITVQVPVNLTPALPRLKLQLSPNPTDNKVKISFTPTQAGQVKIHLLNVQGQVVAQVAHMSWVSQAQEFEWETKAKNGQQLPAGNYWIVLQQAGERLSKQLKIVR